MSYFLKISCIAVCVCIMLYLCFVSVSGVHRQIVTNIISIVFEVIVEGMSWKNKLQLYLKY